MALALFAVLFQVGASGQNQTRRLVYDTCGPVLYDESWQIVCSVQGEISTPGTNPAWSPDGQRIAVSASGLTIYHVVDGSATVVMPDTVNLEGIQWSPDNSRVAFMYGGELAVINADGSGFARLTNNIGFRGGYAWSPDGTRIAFAAWIDGVGELFLMRADGSNKTRLTYNVGFDVISRVSYRSAPSWSPDGVRIAFDCGNDICSINADGTNVTRLTFDSVSAFGAVFSPVDGRIAFTTGRFGGYEVAILGEDGGVTRLASGHTGSDQAGTQHAWSPDGQSLAFVEVRPDPPLCMDQDNRCVPGQNDMVYRVNGDGSGLQEVGAGHHPDWGAPRPGQPVAMFTYSCSGPDCQFDARASFDSDGSITSFGWDFGDGTSGVGATPSHRYATGSAYLVKLTVIDNAGVTSISTRNVAANAPPTASFTVTCNGSTCTFDPSSSSDPDGTIVGYNWNFGDYSYLQSSGAPVTHVYRSGTFAPQLQVVDNGGLATSAFATVTIVNALPIASFTVTCAGLTCTFDASGSSDDDSIQQHSWYFGDGRSASGKVVSNAYQSSGTYQVSLTVSDMANQTSTSTTSVTVAPPVILEMHVGNLSAASTSTQKTWNALVTVQIHGVTHQTIAGVTVSGTWSDGAKATCLTDATGSCVLARTGLLTKTTSITMAVTGAAYGPYVYKPTANHDVDGGSNGTGIVVKRR